MIITVATNKNYKDYSAKYIKIRQTNYIRDFTKL